mmetsp:Transcript_88606/g.228510  ORF Transcript_88606/g.228510 Transcript_88606/m.228510 type:complete len:211 (-) Transcript_88606:363-995(-)
MSSLPGWQPSLRDQLTMIGRSIATIAVLLRKADKKATGHIIRTRATVMLLGWPSMTDTARSMSPVSSMAAAMGRSSASEMTLPLCRPPNASLWVRMPTRQKTHRQPFRATSDGRPWMISMMAIIAPPTTKYGFHTGTTYLKVHIVVCPSSLIISLVMKLSVTTVQCVGSSDLCRQNVTRRSPPSPMPLFPQTPRPPIWSSAQGSSRVFLQ